MNRFQDRVEVDVREHIAYVKLDRAEKHNGMDFAMLEAVIAASRFVKKQRGVRAAIVYGDGPSFCAGLDFKTVMGKPVQAALGYTQLWWPRRNDFQSWSMGWRELAVPVIAAVHGNCFGAGIQLALGADLRIATPTAKFSVMESRWGLIPDMGGAALLRELVPIDVAKELMFSGRVLSGTDAKALGLVTHLADDPLVAAEALAAEFATRSPDAVAAAKFLAQEAWSAPEASALTAERRWQRRLMLGQNQRISVTNNLGKAKKPWAPRSVKGL